jgi:ligand-binding sensor domain-containing protein/signal transduction histidine kinase/AraC-like DNA-binding protein
MIKKILLFILHLNFSTAAWAQLSFDHITVANGLSQSTVLSIYKDSHGYMWFGTRYGLNKYNAQHIKTYDYQSNDPSSISCSDYIYTILEDKKHNLWIGTRNGLNRYLPESDSFERILNSPSHPAGLSDNTVFCSYQDSKGNIWFGTNNGLNMLSSSSSRKFTHFYTATKSHPGLAGAQVYAIHEDRQKNIWIGTNKGVTRMSKENGQYVFTSFSESAADPASLKGDFVKTIAEDQQGRLWIGTETGGLNLFQPVSSTFSHYFHSPLQKNSLSSNDIRKIIVDQSGRLWIATIDGLNVFDPENRQFQAYDHDPGNPKSLSDNSIKDIYIDNQAAVWIGTMFGGVNVMHPNVIPFVTFQSSKLRNSISSNIVSAIISDPKGNLWIGTEGKGLNYYDTAAHQFKAYQNNTADPSSIGTNFIKAIYKDKSNRIWVGLHQGGLDLFLPASNSFKHYRHNPEDHRSISSDIVSSILEDSWHRLWVGTSAGLDIFDPRMQQFRSFLTDSSRKFRLTSNWIRCIYEDSKQNLWVGTGTGLNLMETGSKSFKPFLANTATKKSLQGNYINCVKEDYSGRIWIGVFHGGLSLYQPGSRSFKTYTIKDGLPGDNILNIQPDDNDILWISTDNGLSKFNVKTGNFKNYTVRDGLPTNEFNYSSCFRDSNGKLYFGTYNGLLSFTPRQIRANAFAPPVVFTGLRLFNQPVRIKDQTELLAKDISFSKELTFTHDQNVFSLEFSALNYNKPDRNLYRYKMEGFEKNWNEVSIPSATYTNLPAGDYVFLVSGSNNDGLWNTHPKRLLIHILPPYWKTWWAYLLYLLCSGAVLFLVIRFFRRQARLERDLYYEQLDHARQHGLYQMKLDFFTKVSHEIRTPLTLILAPLEKLLNITVGDAPVNRQLKHVKQNADRLIRLISELLDFRKIETDHLVLKVSKQDIVQFSRRVFDSFAGWSEDKKISYHFSTAEDAVQLYFDPLQFEKVLFNLLSNAFKFTAEGGAIRLSIECSEKHIEICVSDNGIGIPEDEQVHVFDTFYQSSQSLVSPGWGLGLALAKNIVQLHKGTIKVKSTAAFGDNPGDTGFTVTMLKGNAHFSAKEMCTDDHHKAYSPAEMQGTAEKYSDQLQGIIDSDIEIPERPTVSPLQENYTVLLVEDNDEVRGFIKESLEGQYKIQEAVNGMEGWEIAVSTIPDLIISDVTMPVMDGLQLCSRIKGDERTSHIPVVLLTARADYIHQLGGLEKGADAYIVKPFSIQLLELSMRNLFLARESMRKKYGQQITLLPQNKIIQSADEKFLARLMHCIEQHIEDADFGVTALVNEIGMSQTVLYRKIKALTGLTIVEFIKSVRLNYAMQLLIQHQLGIAEIAYAAGFSDRKYFSKEFRKQFGKSPSEFLDDHMQL